MSVTVYLHGWAMNGRVFDGFRRRVSGPSFAPDWISAAFSGSLKDWKTSAAALLPEGGPVTLFGWSMGGMLALWLAAHYPKRVARLVVCSSCARFTAADDYPQGHATPALSRALSGFENDYAQEAKRFLQLQLLRAQSPGLLDEILPGVLAAGPAHLAESLQALYAADMRELLPSIAQPTLVIAGGRDAITPVRMADYLAEHLNAPQVVVPEAAHVPFLSHPEAVKRAMQSWGGA